MSIERCFESGTVVYELRSAEKLAAISELIRRAPVFQEIRDLDILERTVIAREKLQSTGFGHGVAVAHGRMEGLERLVIGCGLSRGGIPFESPDGLPVHFLFIIACPPRLSIDYLQALSSLVRVLRDCAVRDALLAAEDEGQAERTIREAFSLSIGRLLSTA